MWLYVVYIYLYRRICGIYVFVEYKLTKQVAEVAVDQSYDVGLDLLYPRRKCILIS